ncbi:hypothetical protein [Sinorhizobium meliloti]
MAGLAGNTDGSEWPGGISDESFADALRRWNGDIFWEPASQSTDSVTRFGDEARAVFGPIPEADCGSPDARIFPLEVDGNIVDLVPNPDKPGRVLEFQHRDVSGNVVKWTTSIPKCDKPSLAGTVAYCGLNSRLHRVVRGNVEWLFFCRKSNSSQEVASDPFWQSSDPRFALLGTIGFNKNSGEIVFFDGRKDRAGFDWSKPFVPPGGHSYTDATGRAAAAALYDPTFQIRCHSCHDNKSPYVIDPHVGQSRVGYFLGGSDARAVAFSLGDYLPERSRLEGAPFRIVGSGYTSKYGGGHRGCQNGAGSDRELHELPHVDDTADRQAPGCRCRRAPAIHSQSRLGADARSSGRKKRHSSGLTGTGLIGRAEEAMARSTHGWSLGMVTYSPTRLLK